MEAGVPAEHLESGETQKYLSSHNINREEKYKRR